MNEQRRVWYFFFVVCNVSMRRNVNHCVDSHFSHEGFILIHYLVMKKDGNNIL